MLESVKKEIKENGDGIARESLNKKGCMKV